MQRTSRVLDTRGEGLERTPQAGGGNEGRHVGAEHIKGGAGIKEGMRVHNISKGRNKTRKARGCTTKAGGADYLGASICA